MVESENLEIVGNIDDQIDVKYTNNENLTIGNDGYFVEQFYREKIFDSKEFSRVVKSVEKIVRTSKEYKNFIATIFEDFKINGCSILGNINSTEDIATIEIDHYPFTLYDITSAVLNSFLDNGTKFNTFILAREVMRLHYEMKIGIVPVSLTVHQLRHSGKIFISLKQVIGQYMEFAKEYQPYIDQEVILNFVKLIEMTKNDDPISKDPEFLKVLEQDCYSKDNPPPAITCSDQEENLDETSN